MTVALPLAIGVGGCGRQEGGIVQVMSITNDGGRESTD